jgi:peptidoglycan hydrolase-like protein with peptidoglycan-binding domain
MAPVSPDLIRVQGRLKELGHDPGPIDGRLGLQTKAALKAFQTDYGLPATGEIDAETRAALGLGRNEPP